LFFVSLEEDLHETTTNEIIKIIVIVQKC